MTTSMNLDYDEVREYIRNSSPESVVMIGCDSVRKQSKGKASARYSAVVCVRKATGHGDDIMYHGSKVFGASVVLPDYGVVERSGKLKNLKMRMMQEVTFVLEVFDNIQDVLDDRPFEIHLDISSKEDCESSVAMSEARGYVRSMSGREPKFKPYALAASFAADAHAHGLLD